MVHVLMAALLISELNVATDSHQKKKPVTLEKLKASHIYMHFFTYKNNVK